MAHTVSGASLEGIYNRLNGIEQHHPLEADTFADWSVEAGDVVTISRDGKSYQSPIHTSTMKWQGKAPMVSVSSTGNEKREPISKVSRQKYSRGGSGGYRSNRSFYNEIWSEDGYLHSVLSQTESNFHVYVEDTYAQLRSGLEATSSSARLYASSAENAAQIVARINASTGESEIQLDANKVYIGNTRSTTVISGKLNVADLSSEISSLAYVATKSLSAQRFSLYESPAESTTAVNLASTALRTAALTQSGNTYYLHLYAIDGTECVSTRDNALSFSRATTLAGVWSGGTFTVNASPQGNTIASSIFDLRSEDISWSGRTGTITIYANLDGGETRYNTGKTLTVTAPLQHTTIGQSWNGGTLTITATNAGDTATAGLFSLRSEDISWNGNIATITLYANKDGGETRYNTGKTLTVDASARYQAGFDDADGQYTRYSMAKVYNTNDSIYYGKFYNSSGTALTSGSYYWYGSSHNWNGGNANANLYRKS